MELTRDHELGDDLIGAIYQASMEPAIWQTVVDRILGGVGAHSGQLWSPFKPVEAGGLVIGKNVDETPRSDYLEHFHKYDIWNQRTVERGLLFNGSAFLDQDLVSREEWANSEFWNEFLQPQDMFRLCAGILDDGKHGELPVVALACYRGVNAPPFDAAQRAYLGRLLPHMRRSLIIQSRLEPASKSPAELAIECLNVPALALGRHGEILFANQAAGQLMRGTSSLRQRNGCLRVTDGQGQRQLDEMLCHCADGFRRMHHMAPSAFAIGGEADNPDSPDNRLILSFAPVVRNAIFHMDETVAILFIRRAGNGSTLSAQELQSVYRLTRSEALLAIAVVNGASLEQHANTRGVTINTVRSQMKQILAKVGASRQADMVRILLSGHTPIAPG